ncbi:hypothetical protein ACLQ2R_13270 [Streptosporangium sp. DT93]
MRGRAALPGLARGARCLTPRVPAGVRHLPPAAVLRAVVPGTAVL